MNDFTKIDKINFRLTQSDRDATAKLAAIMASRGYWNVCPTEVMRFALREAVKASREAARVDSKSGGDR